MNEIFSKTPNKRMGLNKFMGWKICQKKKQRMVQLRVLAGKFNNKNELTALLLCKKHNLYVKT